MYFSMWTRVFQMAYNIFFIRKGADKPSKHNSGFSAQRAEDHPGAVLILKDELEADFTESMLASQELRPPVNIVPVEAD